MLGQRIVVDGGEAVECRLNRTRQRLVVVFCSVELGVLGECVFLVLLWW